MRDPGDSTGRRPDQRGGARRAAIAHGAVVAAAVLLTSAAHRLDAAEPRDLDLQRFKPAPGALDLLAVPSARLGASGDWHLLASVHWARSPLRLVRTDDGGTVSEPLGHQLGLELGAAVVPWDRLELGLVLPLTLHQGPGGSTSADPLSAGALGATGFGDLTFTPKLLVVRTDGLWLSVSAPVSLPTAMGDAFAGSGAVTVRPRLLGEMALGPVRLTASAGGVLRPSRTYLGLRQGPAVELGLGAALPFRVSEARLTALATLAGEVPLEAADEAQAPAELLAGLRWHLDGGPALTLAAGPGLTEGAGTPRFRALFMVGWTPGPRPGPAARPARTVAAPPAPAPPAPQRPPRTPVATVDTAQGRIRAPEPVFFAKDSDEILFASHPTLRAVAQTLREHPEIRRLRVEGHTDAEGDADYNLRLSERRAASVVRFLVAEGIAAERLSAVGHGERRPVEPNATAEGRARNRRVEFTIVERTP